jgi:hypothetical protein
MGLQVKTKEGPGSGIAEAVHTQMHKLGAHQRGFWPSLELVSPLGLTHSFSLSAAFPFKLSDTTVTRDVDLPAAVDARQPAAVIGAITQMLAPPRANSVTGDAANIYFRVMQGGWHHWSWHGFIWEDAAAPWREPISGARMWAWYTWA